MSAPDLAATKARAEELEARIAKALDVYFAWEDGNAARGARAAIRMAEILRIPTTAKAEGRNPQ